MRDDEVGWDFWVGSMGIWGDMGVNHITRSQAVGTDFECKIAPISKILIFVYFINIFI